MPSMPPPDPARIGELGSRTIATIAVDGPLHGGRGRDEFFQKTSHRHPLLGRGRPKIPAIARSVSARAASSLPRARSTWACTTIASEVCRGPATLTASIDCCASASIPRRRPRQAMDQAEIVVQGVACQEVETGAIRFLEATRLQQAECAGDRGLRRARVRSGIATHLRGDDPPVDFVGNHDISKRFESPLAERCAWGVGIAPARRQARHCDGAASPRAVFEVREIDGVGDQVGGVDVAAESPALKARVG